ncbi:MAG: hypothetical protein LBH70_07285 [Spirochaetaceae bacterium]|jgi:tetratricopeptide (TPR) repeat protein|nr:hypothetical protein [Spirochaetaceae bacterium]
MTTPESGSPSLLRGFGRRYYRLALSAAARRDLSGAAICARYAVMLDPEHRDAAHLLQLCLRELGEPGGMAGLPEDSEKGIEFEQDSLEQVRLLAAKKKWRKAAQAARSVPQQSARILNAQGCLWALAGNPAKAADCFAQALGKDRGSRLAAEGLAELSPKRKWFWGILGMGGIL